MKKILIFVFLYILSLTKAGATVISYDVTNISGNTWEYSYSLSNDTLAFDIQEFTIYFDYGVYQNLSITPLSSPAGWDSLVIQPGAFLTNDGYFDSFSLAGLAPGDSVGLFSVQFDFLGTGGPGSQFFEIVSANDFSVLDSGYTSLYEPPGTSAVPVPAAIWLFGSGLIGLVGVLRKSKHV